MKHHDDIDPPRWPLRLLRFFVKKGYREEIEGDMEEIFRDNLERHSVRKARIIYTREIFMLMRPVLMKNLTGMSGVIPYPMFKNYFKTSLRSLMRNPLNSFINIFGLSIAIGICVFAYAFARWVQNTDQFHEHKHSVYLVTFFADRDGTVQQFGKTPRPLGEMLRNDFAHIRKVCRVDDRNVVIKSGAEVFYEQVRYVDPEFLEMFTFPLKWETPHPLNDMNNIVLSEDMSVKYFGDANPVGREVLLKFDETRSKVFKVAGVAAEFPAARTIKFDFLINFENLRIAQEDYDYNDWREFVNATFVQVDSPEDVRRIQQGMNKYRSLQNASVEDDWALDSFGFQPLATLHSRAADIRDNISRSTENDSVSSIFFFIIGAFLLALACLNYINIAIVSATKRLKEIGIRKTIGATRSVVVVQFLTENIVVTFFALLVGLVLGATLFIPWFENTWHFSMGFHVYDPNLWIYLPAILLFTGIASGSYPAFYISGFQVSGILRGALKFGKKNPLTKLFLSFQLVLACIFITAAVMFAQNTIYLGKRGWGYDHRQVLYVRLPDQAAFGKLNALMQQYPGVMSVSGSTHHLGKSHTTAVMRVPGHQFEADQLSVDPRYFETMGLQLQEGRVFKDHEGSDRNAVVVNASLANSMAWGNPMGQVFKIDSMSYEIIGVVKDFHSYNFSKKVPPTIFKVADKDDYHYLSAKVRPGAEQKTFQAMQAMWSQHYPEIPFEGGYQEDVWGNYYERISIHATVWKIFAFIAVTLACLGLYGLMTLNIAGRAREFSIRKVLGAGLKNLADNISRQYLVLLAAALSVGVPVSHILMNLLFEMAYSYHMPITYSGAILAAMILLLVVVGTVSIQIKKVLQVNPVTGLRE